MYYPINWPKIIRVPGSSNENLCHVSCNRDKVLIAVLSLDSLIILHAKPCVPITLWKRDETSIERYGVNQQLEWRPDSSQIAVTTAKGYLCLYQLSMLPDGTHFYEQKDSQKPGLRRESAELYVKDAVPPLKLELSQIIPIDSGATSLICIRDELMICTRYGHILRYFWNGTPNRDYSLDLRRIPFCVDQLTVKAVPITEPDTYIVQIDYSPLLGGFAAVFNDGRGAFLTASTLKFDPNQVQGIWAPLDDATCTAINHRYRLMTFGRRSSHADVFSIDETSGGLQLSHRLQLSSRDYPGCPGPVQLLRWSPDGCCLALAWNQGAISLWSTFGALLLCTLNWDFGVGLSPPGTSGLSQNPLKVHTMDWGIEGYQLWMVSPDGSARDNLIQLEIVKSPLTANPCMTSKEKLYLHGDDRIYINVGDAPSQRANPQGDSSNGSSCQPHGSEALLSSKQWLVVPVPSAYLSGNWPLRFASLDSRCENLAVAGRTGLAIYSLVTRRWKLFGNESQEKDFIVTGGLWWWRHQLVLGCYNIAGDRDEVRLYPRDSARLDNAHCSTTVLSAQILLLSVMKNHLLVYTADCHIHLFDLEQRDSAVNPGGSSGSSTIPASIYKTQEIDVSTLGLHPACLVAATLTTLSTEPQRFTHRDEDTQEVDGSQNVLLNVCGRVLLIQRETHSQLPSDGEDCDQACYAAPTVLASCVEILWVPNPGSSCPRRPHLTQALWLCCGAHGMRVWLPLYPRDGDKSHTFMSKRIMLPFQLHIYPLSVLFEEAILLGVESDTLHYPSPAGTDWLRKMPYCVLERNSQVYLHHIFRQLIRRNLGFHAWEIARGCTNLPYFTHSLELLLHEVLEEEATSKVPIPDALLPSVLEFIQEFPVYLTTIVQCARKTEVALWPYLFAAAGNPRTLFQRCLDMKHLDIAASYLIILQSMEPVAVSRQYATVLLDAALEVCCWDLAKDLVRFLRAIDPAEADVPSTLMKTPSSAPSTSLLASKIALGPQTPPVSPNVEDLNYLLGSIHVHRGRSLSTTSGLKSPLGEVHRELVRTSSDSRAENSTGSSKNIARKRSAPILATPPIPTTAEEPSQPAEELFLDVILQRHARRLLFAGRLKDLGHLTAHFDFPLVSWLSRERTRAAKIDDFVSALRRLHLDFQWPYPSLPGKYRRHSSQSGRSNGFDVLEVDVTHVALPLVRSGSYMQTNYGDSGYLSNGNDTSDPVAPWPASAASKNGSGGLLLQTVEAHLKPHVNKQEDGVSEAEEATSSVWGCDDRTGFDTESLAGETAWNLHSMAADFDAWNAANSDAKGDPKAEMQLRYLLQLFMEAECLDWALILSVILRDAMAVLRLVGLARTSLVGSPSSVSPNSHLDMVTRLRDGLLALSHWVETESQGYRPFISAIYGQIGVLTKLILPQKLVHSPLPSPQTIHPPVTIATAGENQELTKAPRTRNVSATLQTPLVSVDESEELVSNGKVELLEQPIVETRPKEPVNEEVGRNDGAGCVIS